MNNYAIIVKNLSKTFTIKRNFFMKKSAQNLNALQDISFSVPKGTMLGIVGLNGSGKSTLLRTISGIYTPTSGSVKINGKIAPLLHLGVGFQDELDASENIKMYGLFLGFTKSEIVKKIDKIIDFAELNDYRNLKLKQYSTGMRIRLAFSVALEVNPDILLVDEVLSVGDISFREKSFNAFLNFKKEGKTIILTTHNLKLISDLCDRAILLHHGKIMSIGEPNSVIEEYNNLVKK